MEQQTASRRDGAPELRVTVHYADKGPNLETCVVSILNAHLSKGGEPCR